MGTAMRNVVWIVLLLAVGGCSHADRSATTPKPQVNYIASTNIETQAATESERFCRYYHAEPAVLVNRAGTLWHFECSDLPTWPRTMFDDM